MYTFFVLDFDGTYDLEEPNELGVPPSVYLIPLNKQAEVENCARAVSEKFNVNPFCDRCIGDVFEFYLKEGSINFKKIGDIPLTFAERQDDYLVDYVPRVIV